MNRGLALLATAACALAALIVLPRLWRGEPLTATSSRQVGGGEPGGSGGGPTGGGGADSAGRQAAGAAGGVRPRLGTGSRGDAPAAIGDRGSAQIVRDGREQGAPQDSAREGPRAGDHALPGPGKGAAKTTADGDADSGDDIPEVAYESKPNETFDTGSQADLTDAGPISGDAGTVAFWLKPEWGPTSQDDASFVQFGDSSLQVMKNVNYLRFEYIDPRSGQEYGVGTNIGDWQTGDWRHITATWTGSSLALYVDGKLVSQERFPSPPDFQNETRVYVGSSFPSGASAAPGMMTQMTVLNRSASGPEVSRWYGAGAPHQ